MSFDGWVILVIIIGIVGAFIALNIAFEVAYTFRSGAIVLTVLWLIGYAAVAGVTTLGTSAAHPRPPYDAQVSNAEASEQLGLASGKTYDLVLGSRVGGSTGSTNATLTSGLFSARATVSGSTSPASAISLGYTVGEKTYILELPTSKVTFIQSEIAKPSVTLWLEGGSFDFGHRTYSDSYPYKSCEWRFHNLLPLCMWPSYDEWASKLVINQATYDTGLAPVVGAGFQRAEITLTPAMYRQLLGIIE